MGTFTFFIVLWSLASASDMGRIFSETNAKTTVDGRPLWGGDMLLTDQQLHTDASGEWILRTARKDVRSRWLYGYIPMKISSELYNARTNIFKAVSIWNEGTCVYFYEGSNISPNVPHLVLKQTGTGCNSWVGIYNTTSKQQIVSLDHGCLSVSTILHELGHALGLWHEQDRPNRNSFVTIRTENMDEENRAYFSNPAWDVDTYNLDYDYASIMQYSPYAFSNNGRMTLVPKEPLKEAVMGQAERPSFRDFKLVNTMYRCTNRCSYTSCSNGGYGAYHYLKGCRCMCPPGYGGASCGTTVATEPNCLYTITTARTFTTPNYPHGIPAAKRCAWLIKAPWNKQILVKFNTFEMYGRYHRNNKCEWDSLRMRKNDLQSDDPGTTYCGQELKQRSLHAYKEMLLLLSTYRYGSNYKGFEASVSFV